MFYEEEIRNGIIWYRNVPGGVWHPSNSERAKAVAAFSRMKSDDREWVLQYLKNLKDRESQ